LALCACDALAQVSGSVGIVSDYRYRGYSLSGGDPAVQASVAWDRDSGAYAGLFASGAADGVALIPYAGFARRDRQGRSWDAGVRFSHYTAYDDSDFVEVHGGVAWRRVALRLHYAPDYFGQVSNGYFEVDGSVPLGDRVQWLLHAGYSRSGEMATRHVALPTPYGASPYGSSYVVDREDRTRIDVRTGVSFATRACDIQLTWQHVDGDDTSAYAAPWNPRDRAGWVLGCVHRW
jgi:hypothetical protein